MFTRTQTGGYASTSASSPSPLWWRFLCLCFLCFFECLCFLCFLADFCRSSDSCSSAVSSARESWPSAASSLDMPLSRASSSECLWLFSTGASEPVRSGSSRLLRSWLLDTPLLRVFGVFGRVLLLLFFRRSRHLLLVLFLPFVVTAWLSLVVTGIMAPPAFFRVPRIAFVVTSSCLMSSPWLLLPTRISVMVASLQLAMSSPTFFPVASLSLSLVVTVLGVVASPALFVASSAPRSTGRGTCLNAGRDGVHSARDPLADLRSISPSCIRTHGTTSEVESACNAEASVTGACSNNPAAVADHENNEGETGEICDNRHGNVRKKTAEVAGGQVSASATENGTAVCEADLFCRQGTGYGCLMATHFCCWRTNHCAIVRDALDGDRDGEGVRFRFLRKDMKNEREKHCGWETLREFGKRSHKVMKEQKAYKKKKVVSNNSDDPCHLSYIFFSSSLTSEASFFLTFILYYDPSSQ